MYLEGTAFGLALLQALRSVPIVLKHLSLLSYLVNPVRTPPLIFRVAATPIHLILQCVLQRFRQSLPPFLCSVQNAFASLYAQIIFRVR